MRKYDRIWPLVSMFTTSHANWMTLGKLLYCRILTMILWWFCQLINELSLIGFVNGLTQSHWIMMYYYCISRILLRTFDVPDAIQHKHPGFQNINSVIKPSKPLTSNFVLKSASVNLEQLCSSELLRFYVSETNSKILPLSLQI